MNIISILENRHCYLCGHLDDGESGLCRDCQCRIRNRSQKKGILCERCSQAVFSSNASFCPFCEGLGILDRFHSISYFNSLFRECLMLYKSGRKTGLRYFFADLVFEYMKGKDMTKSMIIPIPPRKGKIKTLGWDQVELICSVLEKRYGLTVIRALKRWDSVEQKTLNYEDREGHMKSVLRLKKEFTLIGPEDSILLFDDIYTSGSTIRAASQILKDKYDSPISAMVLCSVI